MTTRMIQLVIDQLGDSDDTAIAAVATCGDPDLVVAIAAAEAGAGSTDTPLALYRRVLRRMMSEAEATPSAAMPYAPDSYEARVHRIMHQQCRAGELCRHPCDPPCTGGGIDDPDEIGSDFQVVFQPTGQVRSVHESRAKATQAMNGRCGHVIARVPRS